MNTKQMIAALAADRRRAPSPVRSLAVAVTVGVVLAATVFLSGFGVRPDFGSAAQRVNFLFKFVITLAVALPAIALLGNLMRPGRASRVLMLGIAPVVLALGVVVELWTAPSAQWQARMIGSNAVLCLTTIPLLSLAPFLCLLYSMRAAAPTRPGFAGAACGLAAAGLGATFYAAHCTDDSPLFVGVWYTLAIGLVTLIGALVGRRWLRW